MSERRFGLIVKTPLAFSPFNGGVLAGVQKNLKNLRSTADLQRMVATTEAELLKHKMLGSAARPA